MKLKLILVLLLLAAPAMSQKSDAPPPAPKIDPVPPAPSLTLDDFKSKLGDCGVNEVRSNKQSEYVTVLAAKIRALQDELDKANLELSKLKSTKEN